MSALPENSTEAGRVVFTGDEGFTCHQFIRAIRDRALEVGKQRNDDWMADYAAVLFDGDALKWFESLDDETQTSWRLLRRAILSRFSSTSNGESTQTAIQQRSVYTFTGKSKDECRLFVQEIRVRAFQAGRENDSDWMVRLAFPCFVGDALEWHASLPDDVRADWSRLERAILLDYPPSADRIRTPPANFFPARTRVDDWFMVVAPPPSLVGLESRDDWLTQAKERRKAYQEANDKSLPCWLLVDLSGEIPDNALWTGCEKSGKALYSARAWHGNSGLVVGKCGKHISGASIPTGGKEITGILPFEVLVGDPSYFRWVAGPDRETPSGTVKHGGFWGVEGGVAPDDRDRAIFVVQVPCDAGRLPGKAWSPFWCVRGCTDGKEFTREPHVARVLAWAD